MFSQEVKKLTTEFFEKMTMSPLALEVSESNGELLDGMDVKKVVNIAVTVSEPQILIGQQGQTLFELQRLLKNFLNKTLQQSFYLNLDINEYKKKKIEYLENLAKTSADEVTITKSEKVLMPMNAYERRIVHAALSVRSDVLTESMGEGYDRRIVIKPK